MMTFAGPGNGYVDVFATDGTLVKRLASGGTLNSPWGLAMAPSNFGIFSNDLLVGNFGDGRINAFDPATGNFLGQVQDNTGGNISRPLGAPVRQGGRRHGGPTNTLFFTAGLNDEADGLFGNLVAQTDTLAAMATVADAPLSSQGAPIVGTEGLPLAPCPRRRAGRHLHRRRRRRPDHRLHRHDRLGRRFLLRRHSDRREWLSQRCDLQCLSATTPTPTRAATRFTSSSPTRGAARHGRD